ncbi:hypothetical protein NGA_2044600, partial [Nannochloropsis gaditana CCMP526]|uniref:uncharacterized protein n=1 Tax=Nannochloropsis gaditana (strain CCMP526) TaxID=1093141 RepID=UPI00029F7EF1
PPLSFSSSPPPPPATASAACCFFFRFNVSTSAKCGASGKSSSATRRPSFPFEPGNTDDHPACCRSSIRITLASNDRNRASKSSLNFCRDASLAASFCAALAFDLVYSNVRIAPPTKNTNVSDKKSAPLAKAAASSNSFTPKDLCPAEEMVIQAEAWCVHCPTVTYKFF